MGQVNGADTRWMHCNDRLDLRVAEAIGLALHQTPDGRWAVVSRGWPYRHREAGRQYSEAYLIKANARSAMIALGGDLRRRGVVAPS